MTTEGMLQAVTGAIGESDGAIGGIPFTRLTEPVTAGVVLSATYTWDGTTTILCGDTSEIVEGDWIRLDVDGQYFQVDLVTLDTSITIANPQGLIIPTGSSQSSRAVTTLLVETTLDFADTGKVSIDGAVYYYTAKTDQSFKGIYHVVGGIQLAGVQRLHRIESVVYDRNRDRSALDLVRRAMLVEYAEGDDLNALARNLGVLRLAFLSSDDQFREIVKVLAYNPKGTLYGLQLALEGLVGAGNFSIYEDPINFPAEVFINLEAGAVISDRAQGAAFLQEDEPQAIASYTQTIVDHNVIDKGVVGAIHQLDSELTTDTRTAYPEDQTYIARPGDAPRAQWIASIGSKVTATIVTADGGALEFVGGIPGTSYYEYRRIGATSRCVWSLWIKPLDNGLGVPETPTTGWSGYTSVQNYARVAQVAWTQDGTGVGAAWRIAICDGSRNPISGYVSIPIDNAYHELLCVLEARGGPFRWYWDGVLQQELPQSSLTASGSINVAFGNNAPGSGTNRPHFRVKHVKTLFTDPTDYWSARYSDGVVAAASRTLTSAGFAFTAADVGSGFTTRNSAVTNAQGGNNNGRWLVESQTASSVTLIGETWMGALVQGVNPTRITLPLDQPLLQFPDDLGKEIEILGSAVGNDGVYVIDKLLDPVTLQDLELQASAPPQKTRYCEVVAATFTSETDLSFRLRPNFAAESNLEWKLQNAGTVTGATLDLRQYMQPTYPWARAVQVPYAQVLSAQLLRNSDVQNLIQSSEPVEFAYWPLYLADPLGYARTYLSGVTAAGVIPSFSLE